MPPRRVRRRPSKELRPGARHAEPLRALVPVLSILRMDAEGALRSAQMRTGARAGASKSIAPRPRPTGNKPARNLRVREVSGCEPQSACESPKDGAKERAAGKRPERARARGTPTSWQDPRCDAGAGDGDAHEDTDRPGRAQPRPEWPAAIGGGSTPHTTCARDPHRLPSACARARALAVARPSLRSAALRVVPKGIRFGASPFPRRSVGGDGLCLAGAPHALPATSAPRLVASARLQRHHATPTTNASNCVAASP